MNKSNYAIEYKIIFNIQCLHFFFRNNINDKSPTSIARFSNDTDDQGLFTRHSSIHFRIQRTKFWRQIRADVYYEPRLDRIN